MAPSPSLAQFKEEFLKFGRYSLVRASLSLRTVDLQRTITKTQMVFRDVSEIQNP